MAENTGLQRSCSNSMLLLVTSIYDNFFFQLFNRAEITQINSSPSLYSYKHIYISVFSISVLFLISHHPSLPRFLVLSFIHEGIEVFSLLGRLSSPVLSSPSINSPYLYLSLSLADIQRASARCVERSSAISARLSTLHAWSPTPPPLSSGIIPLTRCGQSESRGKGINRHSSESEYALKRYTPESKLSEEEEEDITLYLGSGSGTSRSIHVHRDNGLPCAI